MKTASRKVGFGLILSSAALLLSACGGGGGDSAGSPPPPPPPLGTLSLSTSKVTFNAAGPYARAPATQTITGTVTGLTTSGTLYIKVVANNPGGSFTVSSVTIAGNSGQADVIPAEPSSLAAGSYQGSITVTACLNDSTCSSGQLSGSPQTISVNYEVASGVDGDTVTPRVVAANAAGEVILRGSGFTGATAVSFGSVAATSITVVSDSEIDAEYPALPAGTYPVTIAPGNITDTASLIVVASPAFTTTTIPYPSGLGMSYPQTAQIEYDAQRTALFVLLPAEGPASPTLLRYAFDGTAWGAPTQISMAGLIEVHLSPDGTHLLALAAPDGTHTSMAELDPITLAQTHITTVSNPYTVGSACGFAVANDGNGIIGYSDSYGFVYGTFSRAFTPFANDDGGCDPAASGNGAVVGMTLSTFLASSETAANGGPETDAGTTADFAGDRFTTSGQVYDQTGQSLGYLNGLYGQIIDSAGTRAYGVTPDPATFVPTLVTFDLTATPSGNVFPQMGAPITLPGCVEGSCPEAFYTLATTPDGATIFVATPTYVIVQPISP